VGHDVRKIYFLGDIKITVSLYDQKRIVFEEAVESWTTSEKNFIVSEFQALEWKKALVLENPEKSWNYL